MNAFKYRIFISDSGGIPLYYAGGASSPLYLTTAEQSLLYLTNQTVT